MGATRCQGRKIVPYRGNGSSPMKLHLDDNSAVYRISSYENGSIVVNDEVLTRSFVLTPTTIIRNWPPQDFQALERGHFESVAGLKPQIVLFGSGARQRFPSAEITQPLVNAGIAVETMDTAAACRTYNILSSEDRQVAAALLMIKR